MYPMQQAQYNVARADVELMVDRIENRLERRLRALPAPPHLPQQPLQQQQPPNGAQQQQNPPEDI